MENKFFMHQIKCTNGTITDKNGTTTATVSDGQNEAAVTVAGTLHVLFAKNAMIES